MPRTLVRAPGHSRKRSLGWLSVAWMEHLTRHGPGDVQGQPVEHGDEYTGFLVDCYALDEQGKLLYDSAFLSRPKGCDKSGLGGRVGLFEALGPCRFAGWATGGEVYRDPWGLGFEYEYEPGEPMGRPVVSPFIRILATEENQTGNVYDTIYFNLTDDECPLSQVPGLDAGLTRVYLPGGGEITPSTASSAAKDGGKETWACFDETHLYNRPELKAMYATVTRNMRKRKKIAGTWYLETTTMFAPGEESTAEDTFKEAENIRRGLKKRGRHRLLYDHRWGDCEDLRREDMLRAAILEAFGEAIEWNDVDAIVDEFYDTRKRPEDSRRYFLNAERSSSDAWLKAEVLRGCGRPERSLKPRDLVTLGFDGSVDEDSTALVACRVNDAHLELLGCWERPPGKEGDGWRVDRVAVDAAVAEAMSRFEVVGFYADPAHWQDYLDNWHREFAGRMKVKATAAQPLEWWTNRPKAMALALQRFFEAVQDHSLSFTPEDDLVGRQAELATTLRRHALNARRMPTRSGLLIRKAYPASPDKIDAIMAAVLAYEARADAVATDVKPEAEVSYPARRIR